MAAQPRHAAGPAGADDAARPADTVLLEEMRRREAPQREIA